MLPLEGVWQQVDALISLDNIGTAAEVPELREDRGALRMQGAGHQGSGGGEGIAEALGLNQRIIMRLGGCDQGDPDPGGF